MKIDVDEKNIILDFDYNPVVIKFIKENFDGRKFRKKSKDWVIPKHHIVEVVEKLKKLDFKITRKAFEEYKQRKRVEKNLKNIKKGDFSEEDEKILEKTKLPLYDYQKKGALFMYKNESALLGDEPGLGKTIQSLSVTEMREAEKILIICPASLKLNWKDEIEKWYDDPKIIVIDGRKEKRDELWKEEAKYYIMNYELLIRDLEEIKENEWDFIIADEATRIKNPKAKQSKAIKKIDAKYRLALTGTPLSNNTQDIWNIMDFCKPEILGNYWMFQSKYCIKNRFGGIEGYKNLDRLREVLSTHMIRREKNKVLDELPPKTYTTRYVELSQEERKVYNAIKEDIKDEIKEYGVEEGKGISNVLVKMVRLKQVTDYPGLISDCNKSSKMNTLKELLEDIMYGNSKAIIFSQFSQITDIMMEELSEYDPLLISGKVDKPKRKENNDKFQNNDKNRLMIMTEAGGFGLNLQKAEYIIHYDLPWSIAKKEQREGRAHRIGQKNNLTVFDIVTENTIDEHVARILKKKQKISDKILGENKSAEKAKFSYEDVKKILF